MKRMISTVALVLMGCLSTAEAATPLRLAAKPFTEQRVLATLTQQYLAQHGYDVKVTWGVSTSLVRPAQLSNELDMVWEYTATSLIVYNHVNEILGPDASYARVSELDAAQGLTWLAPTRFNNTYAIAMPEEFAARDGDIRTLSQFVAHLKQTPDQFHLFTMDYDIGGRVDGVPGLMKRYDFTLSRSEARSMDTGLVYLALRNRQAYAGVVSVTDGRIAAFKLRILEDDRHYFPAYNAAPVVRTDYLQAHPDLAELLKPLAEALDDDTMRQLNTRVDVQGEAIAQVAHDFLVQHRLL